MPAGGIKFDYRASGGGKFHEHFIGIRFMQAAADEQAKQPMGAWVMTDHQQAVHRIIGLLC